MNLEVVPLERAHFEALWQALDAVAREKRFLSLTEAPPRDRTFAFYQSILDNDQVQYVALLDGTVVGWCDILPVRGQARAHVGVLGIGIVPSARHRGIGAALMRAAIDQAWNKGLLRIELTVRTDNLNAKALYDRLGFKVEGVHSRAFGIEGVFHDTHAMALLR